HYTLTRKPKRNINKEEMRQIKVNEERERREDINEGFALLQTLLEVLLPTTYYKRKLNKADLLKKATSYMQSQEKRLTQLAKELNCLQATYFDLLAELENVKM
ncbi:3537_t:CDS:2, partial [Gigaspora margarita]